MWRRCGGHIWLVWLPLGETRRLERVTRPTRMRAPPYLDCDDALVPAFAIVVGKFASIEIGRVSVAPASPHATLSLTSAAKP